MPNRRFEDTERCVAHQSSRPPAASSADAGFVLLCAAALDSVPSVLLLGEDHLAVVGRVGPGLVIPI
jgi:hypothetical protein